MQEHKDTRGRARRGFTLVEMAIAVAVIVVVAAIAIPNLMGSKKSANEAAAIENARSLIIVQEQYETRFGSYAGNFADLDETRMLEGFELLSNPRVGRRQGYWYVIYDGARYGRSGWWVYILPNEWGTTGDRSFYTDESGVIRYQDNYYLANQYSDPID